MSVARGVLAAPAMEEERKQFVFEEARIIICPKRMYKKSIMKTWEKIEKRQRNIVIRKKDESASETAGDEKMTPADLARLKEIVDAYIARKRQVWRQRRKNSEEKRILESLECLCNCCNLLSNEQYELALEEDVFILSSAERDVT